jgi:predicted ATP-dependent protease
MSKQELNAESLELIITESEISEFGAHIDSPDIIGQPRAIRALKMGTEMRGRGYNVFVTGLPGTGRTSAIRKILAALKPKQGSPLEDVVYVYNFDDPDAPKVLYLEKGKGRLFKREIHDLVEKLKTALRTRLESDEVKERRNGLVRTVEEQENLVITDLEARFRKEGFQIIQIREQEKETTDLKPIIEGKAIDFDELQEQAARGDITDQQWEKLREAYFRLMDELKKQFEELHSGRIALDKEIETLKAEVLQPVIDEAIDNIATDYRSASVEAYLDSLRNDLRSHTYLFLRERGEEDDGPLPALIRYGVNVIVDNGTTETVPVIFENHPTYSNLFGVIESRFDLGGEGGTTFMMIKSGSLIRARGGFIVLNAHDLLQEEGVWEHLKRALQTGEVEIQGPEGGITLQHTVLKPKAISIDTKVILTGTENLYDLLYGQDMDFAKHFKITAEFDSVMERTAENCGRYIGFANMICDDESLREIARSGMAAIIEYGIKLSEQRDRLSTRFSLIADLIREADYWSGKLGKKDIDREAVARALEERKFLWNLPEEKMTEMILSGEMLLQLEGNAVGKVNGLAVHDRGYYAYGLPTVISASAAPGSEGIINIEREVGLSGEIHDKWLLIIEGFLRRTYAREIPLSIYANICFEQSYSEIDGDSASSTEVYALLSAIGEIPLRQDIAVTGSVNQLGQLQPVGGISEKIEGFFNICRQTGLSGSQGVIIPAINQNNLMLSDEVCDMVRNGSFHVWSVDTVGEGMELLTGLEEGKRNKKGIYPPESINGKVARRLKEMADLVKNYSS